jgi:hypothetical protein
VSDKAKAGDAPTSTGLFETSSPTRQTAAPIFTVVCQRDDGRRQRIFGRYSSRSQAEAIAQTLRNVGCPASVEVAS